jgi:hypothetical protein
MEQLNQGMAGRRVVNATELRVVCKGSHRHEQAFVRFLNGMYRLWHVVAWDITLSLQLFCLSQVTVFSLVPESFADTTFDLTKKFAILS